MNLYGLFKLGVNIKYTLFSILYGHINAPVAFKELPFHFYSAVICILITTLVSYCWLFLTRTS